MKNIIYAIKLLAIGGMIYNVIQGDWQKAVFFGVCCLLLK